MQLRAEALPQHLAKSLAKVYTIHGDEPLLAQEAADLIRATAKRQGFTERQVFTVQGNAFDWSGVLGESAALSLFASRRIVELRIPGGKPGGLSALEQLAGKATGPELVAAMENMTPDQIEAFLNRSI